VRATCHNLQSSDRADVREAKRSDGYFTFAKSRIAFGNTGEIHADLRAKIGVLIRMLTGTLAGKVIAGLVGEAQTDVILAHEICGRYFLPRRRWAADAPPAGASTGQLRSIVDLEVVLDQVCGVVCNRLLPGVAPLHAGLAADLVDNLIVGIGRVPDVSTGIDSGAGAV